ncbi:UNVERIFIED_CONTAM: hypothetical protein FKN15_043071 [Acipenser sinensis]
MQYCTVHWLHALLQELQEFVLVSSFALFLASRLQTDLYIQSECTVVVSKFHSSQVCRGVSVR